MFAYILLFLYSSVMSVIYSINRNWMIFYLLILPMVILMGVRGSDVGIDTAQYIRNFNYSLSGDYSKSFSFYIASLASNFFDFSHHGAFIFFAFFSIYPFFYVAKQEGISLFFVVIFIFSMGIYFRYYNIMVQGMAIGLCFLAFYYRIYGKNKSSVLVYIVALLTHFSAFFFLPFLLVVLRKKYSILILFLWVASLLFLFLKSPLLFLINYASFVVPIFYIDYLSYHYIKYDNLLSLGNILPQLLFLFVWYVYNLSKGSFLNNFGPYIFIFLFSVVVVNVLNAAVLFDRVHLYFTVFGLVAIPASLNYIFIRYGRIFVNLLVTLSFTALFFYRLSQDPYLILPYSI